MSIVLLGSTSGSCTLQEQAVAGTSVLTLPVGTGTVVANNVNSAIVSGTAVASTSGTNIDFTGIPSWVKRVTVIFAGLSTSGTSPVRLQLGTSSGVETTGYTSTSTVMGVANGTSTGGFDRYQTAAADITSGWYVLTLIGSNLWVCTAQYALSTASNPGWITGNKTTSTTLDRIRITTVGGTDTFDAGTINILYE